MEELMAGVPQYMRHLAIKFWKQVQIAGDDECWLWQGGTNNSGYGQMRVKKRMVMAHRHAYELVNGPIEDDQVLLHACDTPLCVNPSHLSAGTQTDNMQDMTAKGRHASQQKDRCPSGHIYDESNTYVNPATGHRGCRTCNRDRARKRREKSGGA